MVGFPDSDLRIVGHTMASEGLREARVSGET
jgi:hypothetical protein